MDKNMSFYEVINKRRTIRQFEQDDDIPKEVIERILTAGLKAPSGGNLQQCELITITDKDIILDLAKFVIPTSYNKEAKTPQQEMLKISVPRQRSMIEESNCVILVLYQKKHEFSDSPNNFGLQEYGSAWTLIENILLAATYEGLGTGIHVPVNKEYQQIKDFMKIPYNYYLVAMVLIGYTPENVLLPKKEEVNINNKVHWNKW